MRARAPSRPHAGRRAGGEAAAAAAAGHGAAGHRWEGNGEERRRRGRARPHAARRAVRRALRVRGAGVHDDGSSQACVTLKCLLLMALSQAPIAAAWARRGWRSRSAAVQKRAYWARVRAPVELDVCDVRVLWLECRRSPAAPGARASLALTQQETAPSCPSWRWPSE